ncbi:amp dependent CoA ligase [Coniophora puteana RWD-64-598 SS2]|uniref:Amp dependent CoA ligase n=1 Tax=Coniophora puteana (strain RWD-64-598) TaxID=741705 RepID=A0A5M3MQ72_CONPW|nr:amp dependent CoA ligase [Coniophora puteana RWD-64-598 SS2]EIW81332.1 amp dependent CoA ligase [Coniophora puteana RWD-64-598 SS2]
MTEFHGQPLGTHIPDDLTIAQFILDAEHPIRAQRPAGAPWLIDDASGRKVGFEEIRTRTFGLANALSRRFNTREDDVVCIYSPNDVDYPPAVWATHRLGAIVSAANPGYTLEELVYQLEVAKASVIITHPVSVKVALGAAQRVGLPAERVVVFGSEPVSQCTTVDELVKEGLVHPPNFAERKLKKGEAKTKLAFLNFSSGTTGRPKAVMISHYGPIANVIQTAVHSEIHKTDKPWEERRFRPGDVSAAALPLYHIYGLVVVLHFMLFSGLSLVVVPKFNFKNFLDSIVKYRITHLCVVPPQVVLLCKQPIVKNYDLSHVRFINCGAAPLSGELMMKLASDFPKAHIGQGYGLTESATTLSMFSTETKFGVINSSGRLLPGVTARVVRPDGTSAGRNETGELWVKAPSLALGYLNNEKATKETFGEGWLRTGDEVRIDDKNEVFIVDRIKELIKVRGFQVAPAELEGTLLMHPDIQDACVVPVADDYSGEVPLAFVVLRPEATARVAKSPSEREKLKETIIKHTAENKVAYKRLAGGVEFIDAIPKNPSGKILRRVLRERVKEMWSKPKAKL